MVQDTKILVSENPEMDRDVHSSIGLFGNVKSVLAAKDGLEVFSDDQPTQLVDQLERRLEWKDVSMIQVGEVVGGGVLTMAVAFAQLGWFPSILFLALFCPLNVYVGILLSKAREIVPAAYSFEDMAKYTIRKQWFTKGIEWVTFSYMLFALSSYLVAMGECLAMVFFNASLCSPVWSIIVVCIMLLPIQIRSLHGTKYLVWLNFVFILVAVFVTLIYMMMNMKAHHAADPTTSNTQVISKDLTWVELFNGISKILFSYLGCYVYLEMMAEMKKPKDFPKTFSISAPFQFCIYFIVGVVGYLYDGSLASNMILNAINPHTDGATLRASAIFLFLHLMVSYLIISTLLTRSLHMKIHPSTVLDQGMKGKVVWACMSIGLILFSYLIANAIPMFDKIVSLAGALQAPIIGFLAPPLFLLFARKTAGIRTPLHELVGLYFTMAFAVIMVTVGTAANVISIVDAMKAQGRTPFECKPESYISSYNALYVHTS
uniref:Amino acid transporter transmembrane domain-containing protein n=1 Tax=Mucochytrium quahogii TaxID=96639 RepID=A0A7S2RS39_9STRA|mmetsp:Transcript_15358/g.27019  ORF Transcript_15358/g.27019 Transcript_15358/m.27019 type:complete len:488 (+) Transcript_15358:129-1592(+)